ncbi:MAG: hydroxymethylpyrimidine/phosphomethylpyrimidine kinase [Spirochaetia bacterium]|nr:hydroxymethylpyrimidine/phosphomethylpyrimidine kinase [Spirochaetia bacterium]
MISGSGKRLLSKKAVEKMVRELFPLAEVVTPNVEEASFLVKKEIKTVEEMKEAAYKIKDFGSKWVVIKGGHLKEETATDIYFDGNRIYCEKSKRLSVRNVHGTGCTFASAVAALLAQNKTMPESVKKAKEYVRRLIKTAHFPSSDGFGLMSHFS